MNGYRGVGATLRSHAPKYLEELAVTTVGTAAAYVPALVFLVPFLDVIGEYLVLAVVGWSVHVAQERVSSRRSGQSEASLVAGDVYGWQYAAIALSVGFYHVSVLTIASLGGVYAAGTLQHPIVGLLVAMAYPVVDVTLGKVDWRLSPSSLLAGTFLYVLFRRGLLDQFPSAELYVERTLPEYLYAIPETDRELRGLAMLISTEVLGVAFAVGVVIVVVVFGVPEPVLVAFAGTGLAVLVYSVRGVELVFLEEDSENEGLDQSDSAVKRVVVVGSPFGRWSLAAGYGPATLFVSLILFVNLGFLSELILVPVGAEPVGSVAALRELGKMGAAVGSPFVAIGLLARLTRRSGG